MVSFLSLGKFVLWSSWKSGLCHWPGFLLSHLCLYCAGLVPHFLHVPLLCLKSCSYSLLVWSNSSPLSSRLIFYPPLTPVSCEVFSPSCFLGGWLIHLRLSFFSICFFNWICFPNPRLSLSFHLAYFCIFLTIIFGFLELLLLLFFKLLDLRKFIGVGVLILEFI